MANATLDALLVELTAQEVEIAPRIEGFRDAERYLSKPEESQVKAAVHGHIDVLQRRLDRIDGAKTALMLLAKDGFDAIAELMLPDDQFQIWDENHRTHEAAVAHTKPLPPPAQGADFQLSEGTAKPEQP